MFPLSIAKRFLNTCKTRVQRQVSECVDYAVDTSEWQFASLEKHIELLLGDWHNQSGTHAGSS
jgi:hypothetical protein